MNDNEIIKRDSEWHKNFYHMELVKMIKDLEEQKYHFVSTKGKQTIADAILFIKKQNAEIERLKQQPISENVIKTIQTGILKVFTERLKAKVENIPWCEYHLVHTEIDNLVKEMTGGLENGN